MVKLVLVEAELERISAVLRDKMTIIVSLEAGRSTENDRLRSDYTVLSMQLSNVESERNSLRVRINEFEGIFAHLNAEIARLQGLIEDSERVKRSVKD